MLNSEKTKFIFIGTRQLLSYLPNDMTINFEGTAIPISKSVKILGVHFDRYLTFDSHIHNLTMKVTGVLMFINRVKDLLTRIQELL